MHPSALHVWGGGGEGRGGQVDCWLLARLAPAPRAHSSRGEGRGNVGWCRSEDSALSHLVANRNLRAWSATSIPSGGWCADERSGGGWWGDEGVATRFWGPKWTVQPAKGAPVSYNWKF